MTSSRRRWRDLEGEDATSQEEEGEGSEQLLQEKNTTISHSPSPPTQCRKFEGGGGLEMIAEKDESNESRSVTPESAQNESSPPNPKTWPPAEAAAVKRPRFACLENTHDDDEDDEDDLTPIDTLEHQSVVRPLPFRHLNAPSLPPVKHNYHAPLPQAPPLRVQAPPILPHVPPYQNTPPPPPTSCYNHHAAFLQAAPLQQQAPPLPLSGSLPLPLPHFGSGALAPRSYSQIMSNIDPRNLYSIMQSNSSLPEALLRDEESMTAEFEGKALASTIAAAGTKPPVLSNVYRSAENKNLLSDHEKLKQQ